jgi:hypothetical protein
MPLLTLQQTGATVALEHLTGVAGTPQILNLPTVDGLYNQYTGIRFRSDDGDNPDTLAPIVCPSSSFAPVWLVNPVVASGQPQTVTVSASEQFLPGSVVLVSGGQANQEAVEITAIADAQTVTALFLQNHAAGEALVPVTAGYAKTFRVKLLTKPQNAVSRIRLSRTQPLPEGVFDQYQIVTSYTQANGNPWTSQGNLRYAPVPAIPVTLALGPFTAAGETTAQVAIQWLFAASNGAPLDTAIYRWAWDES